MAIAVALGCGRHCRVSGSPAVPVARPRSAFLPAGPL